MCNFAQLFVCASKPHPLSHVMRSPFRVASRTKIISSNDRQKKITTIIQLQKDVVKGILTSLILIAIIIIIKKIFFSRIGPKKLLSHWYSILIRIYSQISEIYHNTYGFVKFIKTKIPHYEYKNAVVDFSREKHKNRTLEQYLRCGSV